MNRQPVKSSNIKSVGYEEDTETLEIEFASGGVYQYAGVPYEAYKAFLQAGSLGQWFQTNIRGRFDFKRMNPPKEKKKSGGENGQSKEKGKTQASSETLADA